MTVRFVLLIDMNRRIVKFECLVTYFTGRFEKLDITNVPLSMRSHHMGKFIECQLAGVKTSGFGKNMKKTRVKY